MKRFGEPRAIQEYGETPRQQAVARGDAAAPGRSGQR
jgi:hypothetical protein